jgi:hypothetical protein
MTPSDLSITGMNCMNMISIQELRQALWQSVKLAKHLLANLCFMATALIVGRDHVRKWPDQEQTAQHIAQKLTAQCETKIQQL